MVPGPAPHPEIDGDLHLVLVGGAGLDRGGFDDADLARRRARRIDVRLPHLRRPLAEREIVAARVRGVVARDVSQPHARLVFRDVQVAVDLETLPEVAVDHGRHHVPIAVRVLHDHRRREPAQRPGAEDAQRVGVSGLIAVIHHQRCGQEGEQRVAARVAPDLRQRQAPNRVRNDRRGGDRVAAEAQEPGGVVLDDHALRVGLVPAEVAGHAVRLAAVGGFQVVIAGVRVPATPVRCIRTIHAVVEGLPALAAELPLGVLVHDLEEAVGAGHREHGRAIADVVLDDALPELQQDAGIHVEQAEVDFGILQVGVVGELRHDAVAVAESEAHVVRGAFDVLGDQDVGAGLADADQAGQVELAAHGHTAVGGRSRRPQSVRCIGGLAFVWRCDGTGIGRRTRSQRIGADARQGRFLTADVDQRDDLLDLRKQRGGQSARGEPQAGGGDRVAGRRRRIDHLDEIQSDLGGVAQVLERNRRLLEGDQHGAGRAIGIGHVVGEGLPRPLHGFPERLELAGLAPVEVRPLELELARADAGVIPLLLLGVERAEAMHDHRALDGEAERVLGRERECLAGVDHRGDGDAADGVGHGVREVNCADATPRNACRAISMLRSQPRAIMEMWRLCSMRESATFRSSPAPDVPNTSLNVSTASNASGLELPPRRCSAWICLSDRLRTVWRQIDGCYPMSALIWRLYHDFNLSRLEHAERTTLTIVGWCFELAMWMSISCTNPAPS